ncbi:MAG: hypothetical protein U9R48_08395 [Chloroflexota bacterium]|nr:hypothetical protein [Chloroflexota bacterium]
MAPPTSPDEERHLEDLYTELQAHMEAEHWIEAVALCYRILHVEPDYQDVPQLLERARERLAGEREHPMRVQEPQRGAWNRAVGGERPRRRRWLSMLLVLLGIALLGGLVAVAVPRFRSRLPLMGARTAPMATAAPTLMPPTPVVTAGRRSYTSSEGDFSLTYPQDWMLRESPAEGQPLRIVIITPQARDEPERITIFFASGGGQSAEQVWVSALGFVQAMHDEDAEDWWLGEAASTSIGGYHARQVPFRYRHIASEAEWRGLIVGLVQNSMNYAFIAEAPTGRWLGVWPSFEGILSSVQFR